MQHTYKELPAFSVQQTVPTANLARTGTVCIDTECSDLQHRDACLVQWGREPEGLNRAGGMSVHTSPLASLLCVSNKITHLHTSRGLCGDTVCNTEYITGGKGVIEVTTRLLSFMHSHAWFGMESETTKCTSTPSTNLSLSLEKCSVNASILVV